MSMLARSHAARRSRRRRRGGQEAEIQAQTAGLQALVQRARHDPQGLSKDQALQLQKTLGNEQARQLLASQAAGEQEDQASGFAYDEATEAERNQRIEAYTRTHHEQASWLDGIHGGLSEEDALKRLVKNFFERQDFDYTFQENRPFQGKGDCDTLLHEFCLVALSALGIKLEQRDLDEWIFIEGGGKIIDKQLKTGNVDHGAHWVFENHHWLVWKGKPVDVLFGKFGELAKTVPGHPVVDQSTWQLEFADTSVYTAKEPSPDHQYTLEQAGA